MSLFQYTHSNYEAEQHKNAPLCLSPRQSTSDLARKSTCLLGAGLVPTILPCLASCADKCRRRCGFHGSLCRSLPAVQASAVSEPWLMVAQQLHNGLCCRFSNGSDTTLCSSKTATEKGRSEPMAVKDKKKDLRRSTPSIIRSVYEPPILQMTTTFETEAPFNFCNRSSVIWYTSGKPTASQDSPFISLTSPGAAVKVLAIPLLKINSYYTVERVG